jgi:integrase
MARKLQRLSAVTVSRLRPGMHPDGNGLYLQVTDGGVKSWVYRYVLGGARERAMGLGPLHTISLAEARQKAAAARELKMDGIDPLEAKRSARMAAKLEKAKAITFAACAEQYIAAHKAAWHNPRHAAQWPATIGAFVNPIFGDLPAQAVDTNLVMQVLQPFWNTKTETASRVRGRIEAILDWAKARGYRQGENPARWKGHLENLLPRRLDVRRVKHHATLPYREIAGFMVELGKHESVSARALEFAILTVARAGEVVGSKWSEINEKDRIWIIPADRMKAGKEHRVPLSERALAIIEEMRGLPPSDFVFPSRVGGKPLGVRALLALLEGIDRSLTVHGFRSTFRDWVAEETTVPAELAEMALAHTVGGIVERAYRRGDQFEKRRALAESWARYCDGAADTAAVINIFNATQRASA